MYPNAAHAVPRRRMSAISIFLLGVLAVLVIGGGLLATLWSMGLVKLPTKVQAVATDEHAGKIAVLMSGQDIPAYTRITRDHLINPQTKEAANFWLAPEQIPQGVKLNVGEIVGRVLKHDKRAGFFFTEDDFLPPGTRPGLVAGIPPGKRSITLDATKINGVAGLRTGDRFDIVASLRPDTRRRPPAVSAPGVVLTGQESDERPVVRVVVENGAVVLPVYVRAVPTVSHSMSGAQNSARPVQEIVLAIEPSEVPLLTEMMAAEANLTAVARSGLPDDPQDSRVVVEPDPEPPVQVIDVIQGRKRDQVIFPGRKRTDT